ncbi:TonB-dependent receptor domain-containing protein [Stenotrophomonas mori]|uniref:TonB-dependent receptor n=1 Tax=Stenotrophomonas mori TaxID=2871096 RepID=A0ABT0SJL9_9GAMM|nr:TonB-dependent receptor [Stenotrophomonas mori]MCL7715532.1 TonB-dependent receptor [Stenotrophomonas mori]
MPAFARLRRGFPWTAPVIGRRARGHGWALVLALCGLALPAQAAPPPRSAYRIPAQPLDEALLAFSRQSGLQLAAVGELRRTRRSVPVSGVMTAEAALRRLLEGSGYAYAIEDGMVTVAAPVAASPVRAQALPVQAEDPAVTFAPLVVSARKRDERWVDVPFGLSVVSGQRIAALGLGNVADTLRLAPGVATVDAGAAFTQVQIRGVSSSLGGNDNGYYLDDIPFTGVTVPWHPDTRAFDLEQVEVLKGPQGTLFGEGSMGGTVRILTRPPDLERLAGTAQVGVSSTRGGGTGSQGRVMANLPLSAGRLALRVVATEETLPGWIDMDDGPRDINEQRIGTRRLRVRWAASDQWMTDLVHMRSLTRAPGGGYAASDRLRSDAWQSTRSHWRADSLSSNVELPASRLTLAASRAELGYDMAGMVTPVSRLDARLRIRVDSLELRWASSGNGPLEWILGYARRDATRRDDLRVDRQDARSRQSNRADAVFGEATLSPGDGRWSVTAGLRQFVDAVDGHADAGDEDVRLRATFRRLNPRVGIARHLSSRRLAYASLSTGFRSGQLQPADSMLAARQAGVDLPDTLRPDWLASGEIGLKQVMADGRRAMQAALFRSRWHDLPVRVPIDGTYNGLANSRGALLQGAELGMSYQPRDNLLMELGATLVDARYLDDVPGTPLRRGSRVYNVPRASLSGSATYSRALRHGRSFETALQASVHSRRETGLVQGDRGDAIGLVGLRLGLQFATAGSAHLRVDNLFDERGAVDARSQYGQATRLHPRSVGVEWQLHF